MDDLTREELVAIIAQRDQSLRSYEARVTELEGVSRSLDAQLQGLQHAFATQPPAAQEEPPAPVFQQAPVPPQPSIQPQGQQSSVLSALPSQVKLERPAVFKGDMDGDSVSSFIHKCDLFFSLAGLLDVHLQAVYVVSLLQDAAYTWFVSQSYRLGAPHGLGWPTLRQDLREYFRPVDYAYQARQALARVKQTGDVRGYVRAFRLKLVRCVDVADEEAMFRFMEGLHPEVQRHVRLSQPCDFSQAAAKAEQIGSTMYFNARERGGAMKGKNHSARFSGQSRANNGPVPMQLGSSVSNSGGGSSSGNFSRQQPAHSGRSARSSTQQQFTGACWNCGRSGHRANQCRQKGQKPAGGNRLAFLEAQLAALSASVADLGSGAAAEGNVQQEPKN